VYLVFAANPVSLKLALVSPLARVVLAAVPVARSTLYDTEQLAGVATAVQLKETVEEVPAVAFNPPGTAGTAAQGFGVGVGVGVGDGVGVGVGVGDVVASAD